MEDDLTLSALRMALPRLVHHSDSRFAVCQQQLRRPTENNSIRISMARKGNPWNNAAFDSFRGSTPPTRSGCT